MLEELSPFSQSRYLFLAGCFNIGLSLIPNFLIFILSFIGINTSKDYGEQCLLQCAQTLNIRFQYAMFLLFINYFELSQNYQKTIEIIKEVIRHTPNSTVFYWLASLVSWKYLKVPPPLLARLHHRPLTCTIARSLHCSLAPSPAHSTARSIARSLRRPPLLTARRSTSP